MRNPAGSVSPKCQCGREGGRADRRRRTALVGKEVAMTRESREALRAARWRKEVLWFSTEMMREAEVVMEEARARSAAVMEMPWRRASEWMRAPSGNVRVSGPSKRRRLLEEMRPRLSRGVGLPVREERAAARARWWRSMVLVGRPRVMSASRTSVAGGHGVDVRSKKRERKARRVSGFFQ
jgi:hypothetical protein